MTPSLGDESMDSKSNRIDSERDAPFTGSERMNYEE